MSAFLGPVHHWLYEKIKYQESINKKLLKSYDNLEKTEIESRFGMLTEGELETIIDHTQIHQWLSAQVEIVEGKLAHLVENIEEDKSQEIGTLFYREGQIVGAGQKFTNLQDAFAAINNNLLDAMPCDKGVKLVSQEAKELSFEYNPAVHQAFKDYQNFMKLRIKWIQGFLYDSAISVEQVNETTLKLKMEE